MKRNAKYIVAFGAIITAVIVISVWESDCGNPDREKRQTAVEQQQWKITAAGAIPFDSIGRSINTDVSERSDRLTNGRIEQTPLIDGDRRIWITVDIPAFRLTLWQNGKEVRTYEIGIGRNSFPLPVGEREATGIIWNPEWIPPDSSWVEENEDVEPGERIEADDTRNPLGKMKIPLGGAILIHEAAKPSDIGRLVSHGCVRMLTEDIFDLAEKMIRARSLPVTRAQIEQAKMSTERLSVKLDPPVWVDINYDTEVVEGGVLHLFPDVYNRSLNHIDALRQELIGSGVDSALLDEQMLRQMLERVTMNEMFGVSLADIKAGQALTAGWRRKIVSSF
jgi:lipoprotein-anchoring transpeptidase ErfK/SrfK